MITQTQVLSKMAFNLINSNHPYRQRIREYAERGKEYSYLDYSALMEITKLYISYHETEEVFDIEVSKNLAIKILNSNDFVSFSKTLGDLEYERDEIICSIIEKYKCNISEDIDEEIELLNDLITMQEDMELASVNCVNYI